jgi:hypothetical protein
MAGEVVLTLRASASQTERLRAQLKPQQFRVALYRAVFNTARAMATVLKAEVKEKTGLQVKYINKAITYNATSKGQARDAAPKGQVIISRDPIPLQAYPHTATRRNGVVARLPGGPQVFRHGFKAKIFTENRILEENKNKPKIVRDGRKAYPVRQFPGPPIISIYRDGATQERITERAGVVFAKQVQSQLSFFLKPK